MTPATRLCDISDVLPCPDHLLTLAEWDALPEDNYRVYELAEGNFLAKPRPHSGHQLALAKLGCRLHEQLPDDLEILPSVEITIPGTIRTDHKTKFAEYAEAGIPHYWILDLARPTTLTAHRLVNGEYQVAAASTGTLTLATPFPLTIDVARLLD